MKLYIGKPDYYMSFSNTYGAQLHIYNHSTVYSEAEGMEVAASAETSIVLTKKITQSLLSPYSDCEIDGNQSVSLSGNNGLEYLNMFEAAGYTYRAADCVDHCYQDSIMSKCGCLDPHYNYFNLKNIVLPNFCDWADNTTDSVINYYISNLKYIFVNKKFKFCLVIDMSL